MIAQGDVSNSGARDGVGPNLPEPHCTTPYIASRIWLAVLSVMGVLSDCGFAENTDAPFGSTIFCMSVGRIKLPLLAIALSIIVICKGVIASTPCPKEFSASWL